MGANLSPARRAWNLLAKLALWLCAAVTCALLLLVSVLSSVAAVTP